MESSHTAHTNNGNGKNDEQSSVTSAFSATHRADETAQFDTARHMEHLLALASHELRTPLTTINGNIQLAMRRLSSGSTASEQTMETVFDLLVRTKRQLDRLNNLIELILHVERIHEGSLDLRLTRCDLVAIACETAEQYRLLWPNRTITLAPSGIEQGNTPVYTAADTEHIAQVIANYLSNALKFSPNDTPVVLQVEQRGNQARIAVRDQGPGLPPHEHDRIWERFYRAQGVPELCGSSIGFGLGLYMCREIARQHGGQVGVESAPGEGATFWCTLPLLSVDA